MKNQSYAKPDPGCKLYRHTLWLNTTVQDQIHEEMGSQAQKSYKTRGKKVLVRPKIKRVRQMFARGF